MNSSLLDPPFSALFTPGSRGAPVSLPAGPTLPHEPVAFADPIAPQEYSVEWQVAESR